MLPQDLKPGELPLHHADAATCVDNLRHNLLLRQQRGGGFGYLLDAEAEWLLSRSGRVFVEHYTDDCERDGDTEDEVYIVETPEDEVGENSRGECE